MSWAKQTAPRSSASDERTIRDRFLLAVARFAAISVLLVACDGPPQPEAAAATQAPAETGLPVPTLTPTVLATATAVPPNAEPAAASTGPLVLATTAIPAGSPTGTLLPFPTTTPIPTVTSTPLSTATPTPFPTPTRIPEVKATDTPAPSTDRQSGIIDLTLENITISVGTTVTWINRDGPQHTSTSGVPPNKDGIWDSLFLSKGRKFSFTFDQPGVFPYWCRIHPLMVATVTVGG